MNEIISESDQYVHTVKMRGKTEDIISGIIDADKCNTSYITNPAQLQGATVLETCQNIYNLVRNNIPYREDDDGVQLIQSPASFGQPVCQ